MKYELTQETMQWYGRTLYRIKALKDFGNVKSGDLGGWIEKESNLSHYNNCWIYGNAKVYDDAEVYGDAKVLGNTIVYGNAKVFDNARIYGNAKVFGNAEVHGNARVFSNARVFGNMILKEDVKISSNNQIKSIDGFRYNITVTKDWIFIGCQNFTPEWLDKSDEEIFEKFEGEGYTLDDIKDIKAIVKILYNRMS